MGYTFFGDLLGISNYYKLSPQTAIDKLHEFYNITFDTFEGYFQNRHDIHANLFSDSLLVWGDNRTEDILQKLLILYTRLINKGLLLRGAIVKGSLEFEPRRELENLKKRLPIDDTLARAVGLEKTKKGSRLLIENVLADELFENSFCQSWKTIEGYSQNPKTEISLNNIVRRICPDPNQGVYELLYFWIPRPQDIALDDFNIESVKKLLKDVSTMVNPEASIHYRETLKLLNRALQRKNLTDPYF